MDREDRAMANIKNGLNKILELICCVLFVFITVVGTYQIVVRYVFNNPSTVSEELLTYSFTWLALLAAALVFGKKDHMRVSFIADKFEGKSAIILGIVTELITLVFAALVLIYGGTSITQLTTTQITASLGINMSYIYMILPLCGTIIVIYNILNILEYLKKLKEN